MKAGRIIGGKYSLIREIGQGGMAVVWEAEHMTLGSPVAVKFVRVEGGQAKMLAKRFLLEARNAAQIHHRSIVEILDFGTHDDAPYMVMELLRGQSLADEIYSSDPIGAREAVEIIRQVLSGLAVVHDAGMIHRDLKPANVFVARDADGLFAKLVDFGLSRTIGGRARGQRDGKKSSAPPQLVAGTPEYMSPEQTRGSRLDARTDIYSTGVMLYQVLSGELPFEHTTLGPLLEAIRGDKPAELSSFCPWLGEEMSRVVARAMARRPEDRFETARQMRAALESAAESMGEPPKISISGPRPASLCTEAAPISAMELAGLSRKGLGPPVTVDQSPSVEKLPLTPPALLAAAPSPALAPAPTPAKAVLEPEADPESSKSLLQSARVWVVLGVMIAAIGAAVLLSRPASQSSTDDAPISDAPAEAPPPDIDPNPDPIVDSVPTPEPEVDTPLEPAPPEPVGPVRGASMSSMMSANEPTPEPTRP